MTQEEIKATEIMQEDPAYYDIPGTMGAFTQPASPIFCRLHFYKSGIAPLLSHVNYLSLLTSHFSLITYYFLFLTSYFLLSQRGEK